MSGAPSAGHEGPAESGGRKGLLRNTGLTSVMALAAVVSGLLLDVAIAAGFGAGSGTDAFFVAARIPIGLAAVLMAGANQALVPAISTWMVRKGDEDTGRLVSVVLTASLVLGGAIAALAAALAWPLMRVTAPGLSAESVSLAAELTRILFLLLPLVAAAEVLRAYLNARNAFAAPAAMHVVMNGLAAAIILGLARDDIVVVAWAYVAGAVAQLAFMLIMSARRGLRFRPKLTLRDPDIVAVGRLCTRPLAASGLNPVARVVEQAVVSFLPSGSISILNYSSRLVNAIGGTVFFRSVMVVLLPRLTQATARGDDAAVRRLTGTGLQIMVALAVPLTAFMAVLAEPAVRVVFNQGRFTAEDAELLGRVLAVYSASLVGLGVQRALLAPFYARLETRIPFRGAVLGIACNMILLPVLVLPFRDSDTAALFGVAIAFSVSQYVVVGFAWYHVRRIVGPPLQGSGPTVVRLLAATGLATAAMVGSYRELRLGELLPRGELLGKTSFVGYVGAMVLVVVLALLSRSEARRVWSALRRGRPSPPVPSP